MKKIMMMIAILAFAGMAANAVELFTAQNDGLAHWNYIEGSAGNDYTTDAHTGYDGTNSAAAYDGDGNVHIIHAGGLSCFEWDASTTSFAAGGTSGFAGGTSVEVASDGTIFSTQIGGLNAWTYDAGTHVYTAVSFWGFDGAKDLTIDANGVIHVIFDGGAGNPAGISAFTFDGTSLAAIDGAHSGFGGGTAIKYSESDGLIYSTQIGGLNVWGFNGSVYSADDFYGFPNALELAIDSDNVVHAVWQDPVNPGGGGLSSFAWNGSTWTATGFYGYGGFRGVFVDSEDNIHVAHAGGISEYDFDGVNYVPNLDWYGTLGGVHEVVELTSPEPPPPLSAPDVWIDSANLYWSSTNGAFYDVEYKTDLQFQAEWASLVRGIPATPYTNSHSLPLNDYDPAFFRVQASWENNALRVTGNIPVDGETMVQDDVVLSWDAVEGGAATYIVYFSTDESLVESGDPSVVVSTGSSATTFDPPGLLTLSDYYWRVDAVPDDPEVVYDSGLVWTFTVTIPEELGAGHKKFIKHGILTSSVVFPNTFGFDWGPNGSNVTWSTWADAKFNSVCTHGSWLNELTGSVGPTDQTYWRWCEGQSDLLDGTGNAMLSLLEKAYIGDVENFAAFQAADEVNLNDTGWRNAIKAAFDRWKAAYPDTLVYTTQNGPSNGGGIRSFQEYAKPDMSFMFTYEFKSGGNMEQMWFSCKDFRNYGKLGIGTVDYAEPIPYGMYYQSMNLTDRHMGPSEFCLGMFGPITYGYKMISGFVYSRNANDAPGNDIRTELFTSNNDSVRSQSFDDVAENNRQILLMSDTLCRLSSEAVYDINVTSYATAWANGAVPGLTGISAAPVGGRASGTDKVLIGHFKALSEKFDGPSYSNQDYFMIMNADYGVNGYPSEYQQDITLTVDSGLESINLTTGAVETLTRSGGTVTVRLDGGRAKLFKFATGAPFVGFYTGE